MPAIKSILETYIFGVLTDSAELVFNKLADEHKKTEEMCVLFNNIREDKKCGVCIYLTPHSYDLKLILCNLIMLFDNG